MFHGFDSRNGVHLDYEMPAIGSVFVTPAGVAAIGTGETAITVTPAALGNAIFDAMGGRSYFLLRFTTSEDFLPREILTEMYTETVEPDL